MTELREAVLVDGVRTANARAHPAKGWFRGLRPDELLSAVYSGLFERNPQVQPDQVEAVFCGTANQTGMQNDIARFGWLASGLPVNVATNGINQQCPSGMAAVEHACRAIMCGEGDVYIASGVEDMQNVPMGMGMDFAPRLADYWNPADLPMGANSEKMSEVLGIARADQEAVAYHSHLRAKAARDAGKFDSEIVPVKGLDEEGNEMVVDKDQWIREEPSLEQMAGMKPAFKPDGVVTAATASPLTTGACATLFMCREKADELGCSYYVRYGGGVMSGYDPTMMGLSAARACARLLERKGLTVDDIDVFEAHEAFGVVTLAILRDLGIDENAPFEKANLWGGALALGHPLGESGCRLVITLANVMKIDLPDARRGIAMMCGGFGNGNASLWEKV
ncbi:MAG: thiolase family protein [Actinobacteria bacterium]|nr:thiolase family protein [Actinomycetota bacterium]MBU1945111.1 thiolase family protein [Actinomycetota bacterium]MBU2686438.1 thiolase family protein [Actinomycetota bacterium]